MLYSWLSCLQLIFPPNVSWCLSFLMCFFCFEYILGYTILSCQDGTLETHSGTLSFNFAIFSSQEEDPGMAPVQKSLVARYKHKPNAADRIVFSWIVQAGLGSFSLSQLLQDEHRLAVTRYCLRASPYLLPMLQMPQETELKQTFIQVSYFVRLNMNKAWWGVMKNRPCHG